MTMAERKFFLLVIIIAIIKMITLIDDNVKCFNEEGDTDNNDNNNANKRGAYLANLCR